MKKLNTTGPGLLIGIPTLGRPVRLEWAFAFKSLSPPINFNVNFQVIYGKEVAVARNAIAAQAISNDCKYLFFIGDDVVVPAHTLRQLIFRMEQDPDIGVVGGVYCSKTDPPAPLVFVGDGQGSYWDWKVGEFFPCTGLGMDCTLVRVSLLKEIKQDWFKTVDNDNFLDGINSAESWTEDLWFLKRVREETKWKIMCDGSVICDHWDVYGDRCYKLPADSLPMRQKAVYKDKKCLILGPRIELVDDTYEVVHCGYDGPDYRLSLDNLPFEKEEFDWVIISEPQDHYDNRRLEEWTRVSKNKLSICIDQLINLTAFQNLLLYNHRLETKVDGSYVEIVKGARNVNTETCLQS